MPNPQQTPDWLTSRAYPFQSRFVEVDEHRIHYLDEGDGPTFLLVNVGMWSFVFRDLIVRLRAHFRVVALDFPGLGRSSAVEGDAPSVADQSDLLEGFVARLGLPPVALLVHDVGGPVGLGFAARHPDRVRALVLANTFAFPLTDYPAIRAMLALVSSRPFDAINERTNILARLTATRFGVGRHLDADERRAFLGPWQRRSTRRATIAALRSVRHIDTWMEEVESALRTTLHGLPTLTVYGSRNDPFGWQERVGRLLPHSRDLRVDGGNHFPFADDPDGVAAAILEWWDADVAPSVVDDQDAVPAAIPTPLVAAVG